MISGGYCLKCRGRYDTPEADHRQIGCHPLLSLYSLDRPIMQTADYRVSQSEHFRNPIDEMMMMSNC